MKVLVDMNLSPRWCAVLQAAGHEAVHWSAVGAVTAPDAELMTWAKEHAHVVFTHDLDFSALLAASGDRTPSVVQVRSADPMPDTMGAFVVRVLELFAAELAQGALVTVDRDRSRVRLLPL